MVLLSKAGLLFSIESLLTPYRNEAGMWSDMAVAVEDLAAVRFLLVPVNTATSSPTIPTYPASSQWSKQSSGIPADYLPQIHGCRDALQVIWYFLSAHCRGKALANTSVFRLCR